jgi:hypothetical protein
MQPDEGRAGQGEVEVRITLGRKEALEFLRQLARDEEFRRQLTSDPGAVAGDAEPTRGYAAAAEAIPVEEAQMLTPIRDAFVTQLKTAIRAIEDTEPDASRRLDEWAASFARVLGGGTPPEEPYPKGAAAS